MRSSGGLKTLTLGELSKIWSGYSRVVNFYSWFTQKWRRQHWRPVVNAGVVNIYSYPLLPPCPDVFISCSVSVNRIKLILMKGELRYRYSTSLHNVNTCTHVHQPSWQVLFCPLPLIGTLATPHNVVSGVGVNIAISGTAAFHKFAHKSHFCLCYSDGDTNWLWRSWSGGQDRQLVGKICKMHSFCGYRHWTMGNGQWEMTRYFFSSFFNHAHGYYTIARACSTARVTSIKWQTYLLVLINLGI